MLRPSAVEFANQLSPKLTNRAETLTRILSELIEMKYGDPEWRRQLIMHASPLGTARILEEFCTITFDPGRQVGKTYCISHMADDRDLILVANKRYREVYLERCVISPDRVLSIRDFCEIGQLPAFRRFFIDSHKHVFNKLHFRIILSRLVEGLTFDDLCGTQIFLM